jgi:hypothetical protein
MPSRVVTKVISAAAVALIVELTDLVLDKIGISEDRSRLIRAILKSGVAAASDVLLGGIIGEPEGKDTDRPGSEQPGLTAGA